MHSHVHAFGCGYDRYDDMQSRFAMIYEHVCFDAMPMFLPWYKGCVWIFHDVSVPSLRNAMQWWVVW